MPKLNPSPPPPTTRWTTDEKDWQRRVGAELVLRVVRSSAWTPSLARSSCQTCNGGAKMEIFCSGEQVRVPASHH